MKLIHRRSPSLYMGGNVGLELEGMEFEVREGDGIEADELDP